MTAAIRELPAITESAVAGLTDEQLDTRYREGGWTLRQVVHHLADSHLNAFVRVKLALTEDHPRVKTYDQDLWADLPDSKLPVESSLQILRGLHERWTVLLESLPAPAFDRTVSHPDNGDMSIDDFLRIYADHGRNHVNQIVGLRESKGW